MLWKGSPGQARRLAGATLGHIGSDEQFHYTAIGLVVNLASRLCDEADSGQILIDSTVRAAVGGLVHTELAGARVLKGLPEPVSVFRLEARRHLEAADPSSHPSPDMSLPRGTHDELLL